MRASTLTSTLRAAILRELPLANKRGWVNYWTQHDIAKALDKVMKGCRDVH